MASFDSTCADNLLDKYDRVMHLKLFVDGDDELKQKYIESANKHNKNVLNNSSHIDAGFDLFSPRVADPIELYHYGDKRRFFGPNWKGLPDVNKLDFKVCCSAKMVCNSGSKSFNTGYYMYPRSSISKTPLRLSNSVGIIDSGYRGNLIAALFHYGVPFNKSHLVNRFDRLVQICSPTLSPIFVEIVSTEAELGFTERGSGGIGSTGK